MRPPTSILVMSILGIIFGALGCLSIPISVYFTFVPMSRGAAPAPTPMAVMAVNVASIVMSLILCGMLLAGSIGSLKLKPWGRGLMLAYSYIDILTAVIFLVLGFVIVYPAAISDFEAQHGAAAAPQMRMFMYVAGCAGTVFSLILPVLIIIFFNRQIAKDAFNGILPAERGAFPVELGQDQIP